MGLSANKAQRRLAWSGLTLAVAATLSACGLEGLKNPAPAAAATSTTQPTSVLTLLAGGAAGAGSADGNSRVSRFFAPQATAGDGQGHVYVADAGNDTIRLMTYDSTSKTWSTVTIAGVAGTPGYNDTTVDSNGNPVSGAAAAELNTPSGIAVDASGAAAGQVAGTVLYVADFGNDTIRKIVLSAPTTGTTPVAVVSTIAGNVQLPGSAQGVGTGAYFNNPIGLALSSARQELYVADWGNNELRRINLMPVNTSVASTSSAYNTEALYNVTLIAGKAPVVSAAGTVAAATSRDGTGPTATFNGPQGLALDSSGNIYVADSGSDIIRRVSLSGSHVTTIGTSVTVTGQNADSGYADGTSTVSNSNTSGTTGLPQYNNPTAMVFDGSGNLLISDTGNALIRQYVPSSGVVSTVIGEAPVTSTNSVTSVKTTNYFAGYSDGTGTAALVDDPKGMSYDSSSGLLLLADAGNNRIRQIVDGSWVVTTVGGASTGFANAQGSSAAFNDPQGIAVDGSGNVYVADSGNNSIRKVDSSGNATTFSGQSGAAGGYLDGSATAALFNAPSGLVLDSGSGIIYVADSGNNNIRAIDSTGKVTTFAGSLSGTAGSGDGSGTGASFSGPTALALDGQGHLFVADTGNNTVRRITLSSKAVITIAGSGSSGFANGTGTTAGFNSPQGIAVNGNLVYVADTGNDTIRLVTLPGNVTANSGVVTTLAGTVGTVGSLDGSNTGTPSTSPSFNQPTGLALDGSGNLFVSDTQNQTIREVTPAGVVSTYLGVVNEAGFIAGYGPGLLAYPGGLWNAGGTLYISMRDAVVNATYLP